MKTSKARDFARLGKHLLKLEHNEYSLQKAVCRYLDLQFPQVMYLSDTVANCKLTMPQAKRNKAIQKQGFKCPDLLILEPRKGYAGLFIELKVKSPFKKNGELLKNEHLEGQMKTIQELNRKGYSACFQWRFETIKKMIDDYLK
ncbi:MAG TPA: hypothetical protein VFM82_12130 [Flavobacteriaceae bacterium]|nr:hypothetical protein [Flavobacteriaceae bacterium]